MRMRSAFLAGILLSASALSAQTKVSRGIHLNTDGAVRIYNLGGSVRVIGWSNDSVAVRGSLGKGSRLHMGGSAKGIKMFVEDDDERNPAPAVLEVYVPSNAQVWVKTATAGIDVSGLSGSLDLYVVSGDITVAGNPSSVSAEAIDGSIRINGSPAWVRAKSASGNVSFEGKSADVSLSTVSGKIDVKGSRFEKTKFETVTGNIKFDGSFDRGGLSTFDTHSGTIDLGVSGGADFDVVSISGSIANKLTSSRPIAGRYGRGSELATSAGEGGTRDGGRAGEDPAPRQGGVTLASTR